MTPTREMRSEEVGPRFPQFSFWRELPIGDTGSRKSGAREAAEEPGARRQMGFTGKQNPH